MQPKKPVVYAFIDGQNLNMGMQSDVRDGQGKLVYKGRKLNHKKFRAYLTTKYGVSQAYLFIGHVEGNELLYATLEEAGFVLVFKTVSSHTDKSGETIMKGNVDTDIVLYSAAMLFNHYDKAVFISGDGDFISLYQFIDAKKKLAAILVPNRFRYSGLLNEFKDKLAFVSDIRGITFVSRPKKPHDEVRSHDQN